MNTPATSNTPAEAPRVPNPFASAPIVAAPSSAFSHALSSRESHTELAMIMAACNFPRDVKQAVDRITMAFTRPALCAKSLYVYSKGGTNISDLSIRAAEELARQWTNVDIGTDELRGDGMSECIAYAIDLETRVRWKKKFPVKHWIDTKTGGRPTRDEREIYELVANQSARRERAMILKLIPRDVQDLARRQIEVTLKANADVTPEALESMLEAYAEYGVRREHIEQRIQRHLQAMLPAQLIHLRQIYTSIKDGMSTAADWFDVRPPVETKPTTPTAGQEPPAQPGSATETVKAKLKARKSVAKTEAVEPMPTGSAIAMLKACETQAGVDEAWEAIRENYAATGRAIPVDVEAVRNDLLAKFEQQADE